MWKKSSCAIVALLLCGAVLAQPVKIGKTTQVAGLVTVSDGASVSSVALENPVFDGSRYVTSSSGTVTLRFENGCEVRLKPSQSVTARQATCEALLASVQSLSDPATLVALGGGASPLLGFGLVAQVAIIDTIVNSPISGQ
jgi:hypothetical protein